MAAPHSATVAPELCPTMLPRLLQLRQLVVSSCANQNAAGPPRAGFRRGRQGLRMKQGRLEREMGVWWTIRSGVLLHGLDEHDVERSSGGQSSRGEGRWGPMSDEKVESMKRRGQNNIPRLAWGEHGVPPYEGVIRSALARIVLVRWCFNKRRIELCFGLPFSYSSKVESSEDERNICDWVFVSSMRELVPNPGVIPCRLRMRNHRVEQQAQVAVAVAVWALSPSIS